MESDGPAADPSDRTAQALAGLARVAADLRRLGRVARLSDDHRVLGPVADALAAILDPHVDHEVAASTSNSEMMRRLNLLLRGVQSWQERLPPEQQRAAEMVQAIWPGLQSQLAAIERAPNPPAAEVGTPISRWWRKKPPFFG